MSSIDVSGSKTDPVEEMDEEFCEFCNRAFSTVLECSIHENTCKANNIKQRIQKAVPIKKERECHICGSTGHTKCPVSRHMDKY
jgi:hypothetical protein